MKQKQHPFLYLKRINLIDWTIIISLCLVVSTFFLFFYRKSTYITIKLKVTDQEVLTAFHTPNTNYALQFHVGDTERDSVGRVVTEIVGVESYPLNPENRVVFLELKVRSTYDSRTKMYSAKGKNINYGTPMRFNLSNVTFDGYVVEAPSLVQNNIKPVSVEVETLLRGVDPSLVKEIKAGDEVKDSKGIVLAKILTVSSEPAEQVTQNVQGELLLRKNPFYKDVKITLQLRAHKVNDKNILSFNEIPLTVGGEIPFSTLYYTMYPSVQTIKSISDL
jgi:hypothetical protein